MEWVAEIEERLLGKEKRLDSLIVKEREAVGFCSKAIKEVHNGNFEEAEGLLGKAKGKIGEMEKDAEGMEARLLHPKAEYAEGAVYLSIARDGKVPSAGEVGVGDVSYLDGLLDCVGELKRRMLDRMRKGDREGAEKVFGFMEEIFAAVGPLHFSRALVPEFRRKQDVARAQLEDARGKLVK
jgi:translin